MSLERSINGPGGYVMRHYVEDGVESWIARDAPYLGEHRTRRELESAIRAHCDERANDVIRRLGLRVASAESKTDTDEESEQERHNSLDVEFSITRDGKTLTGTLSCHPGGFPEWVVHYFGNARPFSGSTKQRPSGEWMERSLAELAREAGHLPPNGDESDG